MKRHRRSGRGITLPAVVVLLAFVALLLAQSFTEARTTWALATRLQWQQRALEAGEAALAVAARELAGGADTVAPGGRPVGDAGFAVTLRVAPRHRDPLPLGYSAGRFALERHDVEADVRGPDGTRLTLAAGYSRPVALP